MNFKGFPTKRYNPIRLMRDLRVNHGEYLNQALSKDLKSYQNLEKLEILEISSFDENNDKCAVALTFKVRVTLRIMNEFEMKDIEILMEALSDGEIIENPEIITITEI